VGLSKVSSSVPEASRSSRRNEALKLLLAVWVHAPLKDSARVFSSGLKASAGKQQQKQRWLQRVEVREEWLAG
jgi:hypothetical protein